MTATSADHYLWLVRIDIPEHLDAEFNRIYDDEHVPAIAKIDGVLDVQRYVIERDAPGIQKYLTLYRVSSPDLPTSDAWARASAEGDWKSVIRPYVTNAELSLFRALS